MQSKEKSALREIRNEKDKLVCLLDEQHRIVEILHKGCRTIIHFKPDGTVEVIGGK